ncbi:hypothetical protein Hanom_Chr00s118907g01810831 [Helianthus anomalus]
MKNKKVKPTYHDVRDPNYIPRNSDDSEDEYQEVDTNVEVSKKVIRILFFYSFYYINTHF